MTEKTCAILPVHVYGNICDVEGIKKIAEKYHLKVIYDAAHAFGVRKNGINAGEFGDASIFSFHATKVFNTIEGGAVCYNDNSIGDRLYGLKNFGIRSETLVDQVGANAKMNEFQAAMGICNLRHIDIEIEKRKKITKYYYKQLAGIDGIILPKIDKETEANYAYFPVLIRSDILPFNRDDVYENLKKNDIYARKYFFPLTNSFQCYKDIYRECTTPVATWIANNIITLPLYADLKFEQVDLICKLIKKLL